MSHLKEALAEGRKLYAVKCIAINEYIICASSPQMEKYKKNSRNTHKKKLICGE